MEGFRFVPPSPIRVMNIEQVRFNMIEQQIRTWEVLDTDVLDLLHELKRENFVPEPQRPYALMDIETPLAPISATEKMWPPRVEARVLQDLELRGDEHVLEVGSGSGYMTALLAARARKVTSVEIDPALARFATENLCRAGVSNATVVIGDAAKTWASDEKYDVVVFTGSMERLPDEIWAQVSESGRVFAIVGTAPVMHASIYEKRGEIVRERRLFETLAAPLVNAAKKDAFVF